MPTQSTPHRTLTELQPLIRDRLSRVHPPAELPGVRRIDLNWARQMLLPLEHRPSRRQDHYEQAQTIITASTGLDPDAGFALLQEIQALQREWEAALTDAFHARSGDDPQLYVAAFAYARSFHLLPDAAFAHVATIPAPDRDRWFFGFWTPPADDSQV